MGIEKIRLIKIAIKMLQIKYYTLEDFEKFIKSNDIRL
jgi:hypothetical protein